MDKEGRKGGDSLRLHIWQEVIILRCKLIKKRGGDDFVERGGDDEEN